MDREHLKELVLAGESYSVEFKRAGPHQLSDRDLIEAVVCLANGVGGYLLLGVEDDGRISGAAPRHGDRTDPDLLRALVINQTDPPVTPVASVLEVDSRPVIILEVPNMPSPVGTRGGVYKRRSVKTDGTPECVPYRPHEMMSAGFSLTGRDYAEVPARGTTMEDLDRAEFDRLRRLCRMGRGDDVLAEASDLEICRALRVVRSDGVRADEPTIGAVLLFGRPETLRRHAPTAECLYQELDQGKIKVNVSVREPLFKSAEELFSRLDASNTEQEVMVGLHRVAVPRIPRTTMREAIANALVHRDYAELGPTAVQVTEDEFRVHNPGGFPPGVSFVNLLEQSMPRSVVLADAFKRAGIVDRAGRGIPSMYEALLRAGRDVPDYSHSTDRSVILSIPTSDADLDMVRFVVAYEDENSTALKLIQLRILHEIKALGPATFPELVDSLTLMVSSLRSQLTRLVEIGLLEAHGNGRNRRYHLTAGFYRAAQDQNAYVRLRSADPIQQDEMVMRYVEAYGSITRRQVASLCLLTPVEARTVLQRLVAAGRLTLRGERRGARYVLPDQ